MAAVEDVISIMREWGLAAVEAYPALSLSMAYLQGNSTTPLHLSGALLDTPTDVSIYEIGSITKTFTGTLLAHAVALGVVDLSTPLKELLPELQSTQFPEAITLLSLATHTSGLPSEPPIVEELARDGQDRVRGDFWEILTREVLLDTMANYTAPPPPPGPEAYSYSNIGMGLLGLALEATLGAPYEQLVQEVVAQPLSLSQTSCSLPPSLLPHYVKGYWPEEVIELSVPPDTLEAANLPKLGAFYEVPRWTWEASAAKAAGCLRATLADMQVYARAALQAAQLGTSSPSSSLQSHLHFSQQLQTPREDPIPALAYQGLNFSDVQAYVEAALVDLRRPASGDDSSGAYGGYGGYGSAEDYDGDYDGDYSGAKGGMGLGWHVEDWSAVEAGSGVAWHSGGTNAHGSWIAVNAAQDAAVVVLSNIRSPFFGTLIGSKVLEEWWCAEGGEGC